ncbi:MAG TPA: hypothetical protein PKD37_03015 [Oligoflexia bacterium]|nr:hypothetical protein [Oligoflexia bacterium]HMP26938.1 hypothetical protein [Oligoflexia bacterium]
MTKQKSAILNSRTFEIAWLTTLFIFFCYSYLNYFHSEIIASTDLPGHVEILRRLTEGLKSLTIFGYDRFWLLGYPIFSYYGFLHYLPLALLNLIFYWLGAEDQSALLINSASALLCASLPFSFYFFASGFLKPSSFVEIFYRLIAVTAFSFWFLNHDLELLGIGTAAIIHNGLLSQAVGWHFLLLSLGSFLRINQTNFGWFVVTIIFGSLLLLSHPLSAFFQIFLLFCLLILGAEKRAIALFSILGLLLLSAFWFLPNIFYSEFVAGTTVEGYTDFFGLLIRHPLRDFSELFSELFVYPFISFDPIHLAIVLFSILAIGLIKNQNYYRIALWLIGLIILTSISASKTAVYSLSFSIHYYRFAGLALLIWVGALAAFTSKIATDFSCWPSKKLLLQSITLMLLISSIATNICYPNQLLNYAGNLDSNSRFFYENQTLGELCSKQKYSSGSERVLVEYLRASGHHQTNTPHYIHSLLAKKCDRESINGLLTQSSDISKYTAAIGYWLGDITIYSDKPYLEILPKNFEIGIAALKDYGISTLALANTTKAKELANYLGANLKQFGYYATIDLPNKTTLAEKNKFLIGFLDINKNLSFADLEYLFFITPELYKNFELIKLESEKDLPNGISFVIVNSSQKISLPLPNFTIDYKPTKKLDFYRLPQPADHKQERFLDLLKYFQTNNIVENLLEFLKSDFAASAFKPQLAKNYVWLKNSVLSISHLTEGRITLINYAYTPFFKAKDGSKLYRGGYGRFYVLPKSQETEIAFSRWHSPLVWFSFFISIIGFVGLIFCHHLLIGITNNNP